jgi:UDP-3-O-[3-hydroxymyristoyl] glucosamine N-acyltransferase
VKEEALMKRTAGELAEYLGAKVVGDAQAVISGVAGPGDARSEDLIYVDAPRNVAPAEASAARCVVARPGITIAGKTTLEIDGPKLAFAKAAAWIIAKPVPAGGLHPTAVVSPGVRIGIGVFVGPYAVIEEDVEIGAGSIVEAFCYVGHGSRIGDGCRLHPRVTLYPGARLGRRAEIHSGAVIGGDGFGYVFGEGRHWKFPQIGSVEIGDDVEIGCNTTIDRGSLDATVIGEGVKIDNLVQVAHNVRIGAHSVIASQTGISGSSTIGARVIIGGQVGIADHCTLEDGAIAGAQCGIPTGKTIRHGRTVWGTPARPIERFKEQYGYFARLPELAERVRKLEQEKAAK